MYRARIDSPFGPVLFCAGEKGLSGLYFVDQKDCPPLPNAPGVRPDSMRPGSGRANGVALRALRPVRRSDADDKAPGQLALFCGDMLPAQKGDPLFLRASGSTQDIQDVRQRQPGKQPSGSRAGMSDAGKLEMLQDQTPGATTALFERSSQELNEYFSGRRMGFDIPLDLTGTPFQVKVWKALCQVPHGELLSYGELAALAGLTSGHGRAVGAAVGRNPVSIIVPCHRIVGANRTLTGYTGGLSRKLALLELEGFVFQK